MVRTKKNGNGNGHNTGKTYNTNGAGRKGHYDPSYLDRVYRLALLGLIEKEIAVAFGVVEQTITNWKDKHPAFRAAMERGKLEADAKVAQALFNKACGYSHKDTKVQWVESDVFDEENNTWHKVGRWETITLTKYYPPDTGSAIFWLKNRSRSREVPWIEIARTELTGKDGGPIATQEINRLDLSDLTDTELALLESINAKKKPTHEDPPIDDPSD